MTTETITVKEEKKDFLIRSTKATIKFANIGKRKQLDSFLQEYGKVEQFFITLLWKNKMANPKFSVPSLLPTELTSQANTWLTARAIQCCAKQASGVVRSNLDAVDKMEDKQQELLKRGNYRQARKQNKRLERLKTTGPIIKNIEAELDCRFCEIDLSKDNSFEIWLTLASLGNNIKLILPFKRTKHFNEILQYAKDNSGKMNEGVRISSKNVTFIFKIHKPEAVKEGITVGIDIGMKSIYSMSNGQQSSKDLHGWDLDKIQNKLVRRKKGSKGFRRAQTHRENHIRMAMNKIDWSGIKRANVEKIRQLRFESRMVRKLTHWTYTIILDKAGSLLEEHGVQLQEVNPAFTSRRCSKCGWVKKSNRKGKRFCCSRCGHTADADINASVNISLDLSEVTKKDRQLYYNGGGFYWNVVGHESIVRVA